MIALGKGWIAAALALLAVLAGACDDGAGDYLKVTGGGFIFNYRIAEATCQVVAEPLRALPEGAVLEARFENPAGGEDLVAVQRPAASQRRFSLVSPPLHGVVAGQPYRVSLRLVDAAGETVETHARSFTSSVDQSVLPAAPLTVGPGYARNPAASGETPPAR